MFNFVTYIYFNIVTDIVLYLFCHTITSSLRSGVNNIVQEAHLSHEASRLSVVSFNSAIPCVQSFIIGYFGFRFTTAYNKILFCCLRHNIKAFCHKQDSLMRGTLSSAFHDKQKPPLGAIISKKLISLKQMC